MAARAKSLKTKYPDPKGRSLDSARPLRIALIECSRIPKCRLRPAGFSAWKSPAPGNVSRVLVEGLRSADPPTIQGRVGAMALRTLADASRPAIPFLSGGNTGMSLDQFAGSSRF